ncbi:hypothetical protein OIU78_018550 [Salix suchowensis]|nr:hypothetical protein OIU78_018550 [Salix suchowensis]
MAAAVSDILRMTFSLLLLMLLTFCMKSIKLEAQAGLLASDEAEALREIATQVGKMDWNNKVDPCSNETSWVTPTSSQRPMFDNKVVCNCSFPGGVCHIVAMFLKGQDLAGSLPKSIVKLPYLKNLDLWANYLSGTIPPEWANTKLEILSVGVNRLTGPIPSYLGNITTLRYLNIQNNMFSGTVPPELGNLINMENITLSANNLTGELPLALANLTKLKQIRLSSNNFIGRIPDFIQSWKQLDKLEIQAGGFSGPIPSNISLLTWYNRTTSHIYMWLISSRRISNLLGDGSEFPNIEPMEGMTYLMLSNCNLSGSFPGYLTTMARLKVLDLSFNRLKGDLPTNYDSLVSLEKIEFDLSYNNFTEIPAPTNCKETLNLFKSSWGGNYSKPVECLTDFCSKDQYAVHINCGGPETTIGNTIYEADDEPGGATKYVPKREVWQLSTTGHVWDVRPTADDYIAQNKSVLRMSNSQLYTNARLTPLSLTYHVRCLVNGNYMVKLHFAEIVMRDNRSFYGLGRRIFDVYIQDKVVLKDFDIVKEAQGVDKAIDIESQFKPPNKGKRKRLIVAGVVVLPLFFIFRTFVYSLVERLSGRKEIKGSSMAHVKMLGRRASVFAYPQYNYSFPFQVVRGYMAPEYALYGYLTYKADVYSFGVVALEIVAGMNNMRFRHDEDFVCLLDWALNLQDNGDIMELVDPKLGSEFNKKEVVRMIEVALLCTKQSPALRPRMSAVVKMLEGTGAVQELVMDPSTFGDPSRFKGYKHRSDQSSSRNISETQSLVRSSDGPWIDSSSASAQDLYPD